MMMHLTTLGVLFATVLSTLGFAAPSCFQTTRTCPSHRNKYHEDSPIRQTMSKGLQRLRHGPKLTRRGAIWPGSTTEDAESRYCPNRRAVIERLSFASFGGLLLEAQQPAAAYTPDPDRLKESLYLMSRVQEATVLQERFVGRASLQEDLKSKMKLTLRLVEKNYRLLDQITFASDFVPAESVVDATTAGYEAAEALQNAIDYVNSDLKSGPFDKGQKEYLVSNLKECRERLFAFLDYMPEDKLESARGRVEKENVDNRDEFDDEIDKNAGVYNPVLLPWKDRK